MLKGSKHGKEYEECILCTFILLALEPRTDIPFPVTWLSTTGVILPKFKKMLKSMYFKAGR